VVPVLDGPGLVRVVVVGERDVLALEVDAAGLARGSSVPSSAQIRTVPMMGRPTVPGLVSQVVLSMAVMPLPSVPA
jgi:hypothetical protein